MPDRPSRTALDLQGWESPHHADPIRIVNIGVAPEDVMSERTEREVLEHLVEICRDGQRGFHAAATYVQTPELKALFIQMAEQRDTFVRDLEPHLNRLGGSVLTSGTGAGAVHRGWMNVKAHVTGHHDQAIVSEAERGEHAAIKAYEEALNGMLPPTVIDVVEAQRNQMRAARQRIRLVDGDRHAGA